METWGDVSVKNEGMAKEAKGNLKGKQAGERRQREGEEHGGYKNDKRDTMKREREMERSLSHVTHETQRSLSLTHTHNPCKANPCGWLKWRNERAHRDTERRADKA